MEIKEISREKMWKIIDTRIPRGLFVNETIGGFVGIDNTTGDAWTEYFETKKKCLDWLNRIDDVMYEQYPEASVNDDGAEYGFVTYDGHLALNPALKEIKMLYKCYGVEKDENLTECALIKKKEILDFVEEIKQMIQEEAQ